ncbi:MAG: HAD hydrolase-like protein [Candidatus Saccharimonadales bacterium]
MAQVVFDFDGTIADSMWVVIEIYEQMFAVKVTAEQIEYIRGLPAVKVIKELGVPLWKAPKLLTKGKKIMRSRLGEVKPFVGMDELFAQLVASGHTLRIMSSNSEANVRTFLREHGLLEYFSSIQGSVGLFVKAPALRKIIKQHHMARGDVFYVGDEARDIDGARKAHVPIISVGWGYNSPTLLKSLKPDYYVDKPLEILKIIGA